VACDNESSRVEDLDLQLPLESLDRTKEPSDERIIEKLNALDDGEKDPILHTGMAQAGRCALDQYGEPQLLAYPERNEDLSRPS
jgi:hypothetical protein